MSLSSRLLRLSISVFLSILPSACIAQVNPQFLQPQIQSTGGHVTSFILGNFQTTEPSESPDILYVNATTSNSFTAGVLLTTPNTQPTKLTENQIVFPNVLGVTPAVADFNGDRQLDFAFVLAPVTIGANNLCVYRGTGSPVGAFGAFTCSTFPTQPNTQPVFGYVVAALFSKTQGTQQLFVEDTANNYIYVLSNKGNFSFTETFQIAIPAADGPGPIYIDDFNGDGNTDILINNQISHKVTLYPGNGDGTFQSPVDVHVNGNVYSMLLHDMNGDGIPDLVTEVDNGRIEIQLGNGSNTPAPFGVGSVGGTSSSPNGLSGNGGHLVAIGKLGSDTSLDILATTPIGLSVLVGDGTLQYQLKGIYNAGPGRSVFALAYEDNDSNLDLYVDSPEGIAVVHGGVDQIGNPIFQTSLAYPAGQPALNATLADVNSDGKPDVVVGTGAIQSQILIGNGDGTFNAPSNTNTTVPNPQPGLWSTVLTGDFDGDGCPDLLYSLTGLPLPTPGSSAGSGLYLQYGNKASNKCDGTFQPPQPISSASAPGDNNFYGGSAVGDFNGDGILDIANIDTLYYDTLMGQPARGAFTPGTNTRTNANSFSQVAAGFFAKGRSSKQDLVFEDGATITPYLNNGAGTFAAMPPLTGTPGSGTYFGSTILLADVDGDGKGDVVILYHNLSASDLSNPSASTPNKLYIWYGNGDGTFTAPQITTLSRNYYLAQVVDMNGDGLPDIILSDGYLVSTLYNQGGHVFTEGQHYLAGQGINSISVADVDNDGSLDLIVANGGATISNAVAIGGKTLPAISLTPNPDVNTGGVTVLLNSIKTKPVTISVTASPEPSSYQGTFDIIATLTPTPGVALPTGTVTFSINGTQVGTSSVAPTPGSTSSATATHTVPAGNTYQGTLALTAMYNGDPVNSPQLISGTHAITGATTTTLYLCISGSSPNCPPTGTPTNLTYVATFTITFGQGFNGIASAISNDSIPLDPKSFISFKDAYNGAPPVTLCTLPVGMASQCDPSVGTTVGTQGGVHVFTAVYSGDTTHASSTSMQVTIKVLPDTPIATLTGQPNPAPQGQLVTFTASVTGTFTAPTGQVTFSDGATPLGPATLGASTGLTSTAQFTTSNLTVGSHTITVSYVAPPNFNAATATWIETINPAIGSTTLLTSSQNPSIFSKPVIFTASVFAATGPTPTGTVTFLDGTTTLGTVTLAGGVATFPTSTLTVGNHPITATFSGNTTIGPSTSTVLNQVVDPLPPPGSTNFSITVTPSPVTVGVGNTAILTVTITPLNGFTQPVLLTCSNLPGETACNFTNPTIAGGGGTTTLLLSTMAPHNCGSTQPYFTGSNNNPDLAPLAVPMLAGLAVIFIPGKRRWLRALIAMVAIAGAMQITGCGTCTDLGTRPNTYTIQVTGTAAGTGEAATQPVTLNVTI